ncbi:hypothetical protein [Caulobacter rhizosphaerae]|uniref:hypothetical protein n=1 Tax=Caulobacter rhizosphaerae TaxID=2010972 RepID=UPI0013D3868D|nr:hypothetical protein [Caulobacter rhizosphaerae]GGL48233.1 hypothetical protein GCM10010983_52000 [Caulobacter rhizosphaerae]
MTDVPYEIDLRPFSGAPEKPAWPKKVDGRTNQRVLARSLPYEAGERFFRAITKDLAAKIMRAAERFAKVSMATRSKGRRRGELTDIDVQILEALIFGFMDWRTGRLEPTYAAIGKKTGRGRATIAASLQRLEDAKILERLRRFKRIEGADGKAEPQVEQAPNAYRVSLPQRLAALIGLGPRQARPPVPDDHDHAAKAAILTRDVHLTEDTGKSTLGAALAKIEQGINKRDFRT